MWIAYFILVIFLAVLLLSLKNGVAYGSGFCQSKKDNPIMYWFVVAVHAGIILWGSYFIISEMHR